MDLLIYKMQKVCRVIAIPMLRFLIVYYDSTAESSERNLLLLFLCGKLRNDAL